MIRYFIFSLLALFSLASCSESNSSSSIDVDKSMHSTIDTNIKVYIKKNADDPSSYQPIKTTCIDTLLTGDKELFWFRRDTMIEKLMIIENNRSIAEYQGYSMASDEVIVATIKEYQANNAKRDGVIQSKLLQIDSVLKVVKGKQKVEEYTYLHEFRLKNKFGALVLEKKYVRTAPDFRIIYFGDDERELRSAKIEF